MKRRVSSYQQVDDHVDLTNVIDLTIVMSALFLVLAMGRATVTVPVELSSASAKSASSEGLGEQLCISIDASGGLALNEVTCDLGSLRAKLAEVKSSRPDAVVTIAGDKRAPLDTAVRLLSLTSELGVRTRFLAEVEQKGEIQ